MATSALGLVYWVLAARYYPTEVVGLNAAIVSSVMFLANISQLNLTNALNRFIPTAGPSTPHLVVSSYVISVLVGMVASIVFALGVGLWTSELGFLATSPLFLLWFTLATMGWCILVLQDSALTGLRQAPWVPLENFLFSLARVGLVIAFAAALPQFGILASWTVPLIVTLILTNVLLFGHLIPQHVKATAGQVKGIEKREIARYVSSDYLASLLWMTSTSILPLIVLEHAGASANAYFFLGWTLSYSLYLICRNMGMSLVAEAAANETKLAEYSYRVLIQNMRLLVPIVSLVIIIAPYLLRFFGDDYAAEGTTLMRLLALSALPNIVTSIYISCIYVQRKMLRLLVLLTARCSLILGLSYALLVMYGINGIGVAWIVSEVLIALPLLFTQQGRIWLSNLNVNIVNIPLRWIAYFRKVWRHWTGRRLLASSAEVIPAILPAVSEHHSGTSPGAWIAQRVIPTVNEVTVVTLGPRGQPPVALLKIPQTELATAGLRRQSEVLREFHSNHQLGHFRNLLPTSLAEVDIRGRSYFVESMLPGQDARGILSGPAVCTRFQASAAAAIMDFHLRTASISKANEGLLMNWIDKPISRVVQRTGKYQRNRRSIEAFQRLSDELHYALAGRSLTVSWVHGDYSPGNILVAPDCASVTGIIDWNQSAPRELPQLDLILLLISTRMLMQRREMGNVIGDLLIDGGWKAHEQELLGKSQLALPCDHLEWRPLILMTWLRHVDSNLNKSNSYSRNWLWTRQNIDGVLRYI